MKLVIVLFFLLLLGGAGWFLVGQSRGVELNEEGKKEVKKAALEYISSNPVVNNGGKLSQSWGNYNLGANEATRFSSEWLSSQEVLVFVSGSDQVTVEWQSLPGCKFVKMWELGYKPELVDSDGKICQTWWLVRVVVNLKNKQAESLELKEVGYEVGV